MIYIVNNKKKSMIYLLRETSIKLSGSLDTFGERGIEHNGDIETLLRDILKVSKNRNRLASVIF